MDAVVDAATTPLRAAQAVEADAALLGLLGVLDVGVLAVDSADRIVVANDALPAAFGSARPATDLIGVGLAELRGREPYGAATALWQQLPAQPGRYQITMTGGRVVEGVWHPLRLADGGEGRALIVTDVTGEVLVRQRLREHNRALAELVATKTELVAALLHELRSPLTSMSSMLDLVPQPCGNADLDPVLDVLVRNTDRLTAVVEEIATISGLETRAVEVAREPVDLAQLVSDEVDRWAGDAAQQVRLTAAVTEGPFVYGDRGWLRRLVDRLLAVGVSTARPDALVAVRATPRDDGWLLVVALQDELAADRLFTTTQGRSNATALMLARAVVACHDGSLRMVARDGRPELEVWLPYRHAAATAAAATGAANPPGPAGPGPAAPGRG